MTSLIPVWILGAPILGILVLAFSFKGPGPTGAELRRPLSTDRSATDSSAPLLQPMHPEAARRIP